MAMRSTASRNIPIAERRKEPVRSSLGKVRLLSMKSSAVLGDSSFTLQGWTLCGEGAWRARLKISRQSEYGSSAAATELPQCCTSALQLGLAAQGCNHLQLKL